MLISSSIWRALLDSGVSLVPIGADRVELRHGDLTGTSRVIASPIPLNPSDIIALAADDQTEPALVIVPAATPAARAALETAKWSWIVDNGQQVVGVLRIGGRRIALNETETAAGGRHRRTRPGPVPWGTLTLVRRLIEHPHATQHELAVLAGISQPRVSQALRALADEGLVQRSQAGWMVSDLDGLVQWWIESYPGPGGISTFWFGLDTPAAQARAVVDLLDPTDSRVDTAPTSQLAVVVSGDVAADILAPWRTPTRAVIYARTGLDLAGARLAPAGEAEATLELVVPRDPGVWPPVRTAEARRGGLSLADPLQVLWDLLRAPGPDAEEAAARLWTTLRDSIRSADGGHAA